MASSNEVKEVVEEGKPVARLQIYSSSASGVSPFWREKYERDAKKYWDIFYKRHQDKFFKDRHYLDKEWGHYFSVSWESRENYHFGGEHRCSTFQPLELLTQNVASNLEPPFSDRLIVKRLEWGNRDHIESIKEVNGGGFDIIVGTDVTYVAEAISPLFATAKELISSRNQACGLILCHVIRRVDEPTILSTAAKFGFRLVDKWPSGISPGPSKRIINSWFPESGCEIKIPCTSLNIFYFHRDKVLSFLS